MLVAGLTIISVYFWGLGVHRTFYENSIISTTILSVAFFFFITVSLYNGIKLKDELGKIVDKNRAVDVGTIADAGDVPASHDFHAPDVGDGLEGMLAGIIVAIVYWIFVQILLAVALWVFSNVLLVAILVFAGMLYWIFFRALKLIFKNSNKSKGNLLESLKLGFTYTILYNFWIYGIFLIVEFLRR